MKQESIIGDLAIMGGVEIYVKGVKINTPEELEKALKELEEDGSKLPCSGESRDIS